MSKSGKKIKQSKPKEPPIKILYIGLQPTRSHVRNYRLPKILGKFKSFYIISKELPPLSQIQEALDKHKPEFVEIFDNDWRNQPQRFKELFEICNQLGIQIIAYVFQDPGNIYSKMEYAHLISEKESEPLK